MSVSDFDAARFWPAARRMVCDAGVEPISNGEPMDEVWPKIRLAMRLWGDNLPKEFDNSEIVRRVADLWETQGVPEPPAGKRLIVVKINGALRYMGAEIDGETRYIAASVS